MGLFVSRNGMETGVRDSQKRQKSRSRPEGREDEIEWARHIAETATLGRSSGFGRSFANRPSRQIKSASGSIATNDVHYSGASAADSHRLPDAPRVVGKIRFLFLKASFTDFVAGAAEVG